MFNTVILLVLARLYRKNNFIRHTKFRKVGVLLIRIVKSNVSSVGPSSERNRTDEGPTLQTSDFTIHIGSTQTFLYFDLYLYSANVAHYVYPPLFTLSGAHQEPA